MRERKGRPGVSREGEKRYGSQSAVLATPGCSEKTSGALTASDIACREADILVATDDKVVVDGSGAAVAGAVGGEAPRAADGSLATISFHDNVVGQAEVVAGGRVDLILHRSILRAASNKVAAAAHAL